MIQMEDNTLTMAGEPVAVHHMTSYNDVMGYLHRIRITPEVKKSVAHRLMVEVTGEYLSKAFSRLDDLSLLQNDWDGYGARKISHGVIDNLREVLLISDDADWKYWMISPAPNGTLGLQSKRHTASISIGDKEYSYYYCNGDVEEGEDHLNFSPLSFLNLMRRVV